MVINISLTLPEGWIQKIDRERGDINRSKYILRLLEAGYKTIQKGKIDK
jgi:hypothetical protein